MLHLLKIEWLKVKNYRTFWILTALFFLSLYGVNYIAYYIQSRSIPRDNGMAQAIIGTPPFQFPDVWQTVTYLSGFLLFIPGLLMIISVTNEYSYKTHRQNIIDGLSRTQFIMVKILLTFIIALASTIVVFLTALAFGLYEGVVAFTFEKIEYVAYFFIQALTYSAIALLFGVLFKRSGIAIGVFFLFVTVLERMLSALTSHYISGAGDFFPIRASANLIPFPFFRNLINKMIETPSAMYLLIASAIYLFVYYFISKRKFETDDL